MDINRRTPSKRGPLLGPSLRASGALAHISGLLLWVASGSAGAVRYFDYNVNSSAEFNSNQRQSLVDPKRAYGGRATAAPVIGLEEETRSFQISPVFTSARFANDIDGDQDQFALNSSGRLGISERISLSGATNFSLDNNLEFTDPAVSIFQRAIQRQSRGINAGLSYAWNERFSSQISGRYSDILFEQIPDSTVNQVSSDSKGISFSSSYAWSERLSLNFSASLSRFKSFDGSNRSNSRNVTVGFSYPISEKWQISANGGLVENQVQRRIIQSVINLVPVLIGGLPVAAGGQPNGVIFADPVLGLVVPVNGQLFFVAPGTQQVLSEETNLGRTYNIQVSRLLERGSLSSSLSRQLSPAGVGAQTDTRALSLQASWRFSDRWTGDATYQSNSSVFQGEQLGADNARNGEIYRVGLRYSWSRQVTLSGGYSYSLNDAGFGFSGERIDAHLFTLGVGFDGDRVDW